MQSNGQDSPRRQRRALGVRATWLILLLGQVVLAGLAFRLLPHGFPWLHRRTVLGTFVPGLMASGSIALATILAFAPQKADSWLPAIPAFWAAAAIGVIVIFPQTGWLPAAALGSVFLSFTFAMLPVWSERGVTGLPATLVGLVVGVTTSFCLRPNPASTKPWTSPPEVENKLGVRVPTRLALAPDLDIDGLEPQITWRGKHATVSIAPILRFDRTSPDGFWSLFAPDAAPRFPAEATRHTDDFRLRTSDNSEGLVLHHAFRESGEETRELYVTAFTTLTQPVFSHLNSFTTVTVDGHRRLGLRFSPCRSVVIDVTHSDYPTGAPARFAYVDSDRRFRIVEAKDAEKGPFTTLAEGELVRHELLSVDLVELEPPGDAFARLEFHDFAALASTALSPTAGYGVAENAIQFGLASTESSSQAHLLFTLAATGIGRGWDSVGHTAGTYRNEVRLFSLDPPAPNVELYDFSDICARIARDIAALKPSYPQLAEFNADSLVVREGECIINYEYHTHRSTLRGGWSAQVPNPDPGGLWFHVGLWDPNGDAQYAQINTQPAFSVFSFGSNNITVLTLDGLVGGRFTTALHQLLAKRGMGARR